jgi:hypothetical protein
MKHGITEQDWEAYTEGGLDEAASDRIEAHLIGCLTCWDEYEGLTNAAEAWHTAGAAVRWQTPLSDAALHDGLQRVLARARATHVTQDLNGQAALQTRLNQLEAVLALLCGTRTAFCALRTAAQLTPARRLNRLTVEHWEPFLERLASIALVLCGAAGAELIRAGGQLCVES